MALGLYIHWPFCLAKCPYCDFNSHVRKGVDAARWHKALLTELRFWQQRYGAGRLTSIFFGGGTPSLMWPATVAALIEQAVQFWPAEDRLEITLEANPTSAEANRFRDFAAAGVNRLSLGVQALNQADLARLGRQHDVAEAIAAMELGKTCFQRFSFDLIYARKEQSCAAWEAELAQAIQLAEGHLSLYQLTIEPGTAFAVQTAQGARLQADEAVATAMYEQTQSQMAAAGMPAYEVSNHAVPGHESRHNLTYWRYGDYVGIGPGAHGRVTINGICHATLNHRAPEAWLHAVETQGHGGESCTPLTPDEQKTEALLMGLRLNQGIDKQHWQQRFASSVEDALNPQKKTLLQALHLLEDTPHVLKATPAGMLRLNAVLAALLA